MISAFFYLSLREGEMISNNIFSSPKNAYSKVFGNCLSSSFDDGMRFFSDGTNLLYL